eukprot:TRINITY_DN8132_c0_g1_i11.p1 TRINITY_DN8132_c0_g1~~TRINITY_DN8132_c0_g1_i11.p1  ORF type:complete len:156 (+),score=7.74 TRINITY_DN8132_c0_g1_i11:75-542(+)
MNHGNGPNGQPNKPNASEDHPGDVEARPGFEEPRENNTEMLGQMDYRNESQVFSYTADWIIYAIGFSANPQYRFRIGIGSFMEDTENKVEIIQLNEQTGIFEKKITFPHKYPPTKLMWIPDLVKKQTHTKSFFCDVEFLCSPAKMMTYWQHQEKY